MMIMTRKPTEYRALYREEAQLDHKHRIVALPNLRGMLDWISGGRCSSHAYTIDQIATSSITIAYTNPDEFGTHHPIYARFRAWEEVMFGEKVFLVDLDCCLAIIGWKDFKAFTDENDAWQCFELLIGCPEVFRTSRDTNDWHTREEWEEINKAKKESTNGSGS
jgi:hypothetical protein